MLAPPHGKTGCPAPQKAGLAPPREIDKTREAKLIADSIDGPFSFNTATNNA